MSPTRETLRQSQIRATPAINYDQCPWQNWDWKGVDRSHNVQIDLATKHLAEYAERNLEHNHVMVWKSISNCRLILKWQKDVRDDEMKAKYEKRVGHAFDWANDHVGFTQFLKMKDVQSLHPSFLEWKGSGIPWSIIN